MNKLNLRITKKYVKEILLPFAIILLGSISRFPALDKSLNELFSFRQTQTAWGAKAQILFKSNDFVTETPVFAPPFKVPFEFPIFQWLHFITVKLTNFNIDFSGRLLALIIFQILAIQLYLLARKLVDNRIALSALTLFELTPFAFQWSTAVLIDYLSILMVFLGLNLFSPHRKSIAIYLGIIMMFILASLIKITTFIICIPVITYLCILTFSKLKSKYLLWILIISLPLLAGSIWTRYADHVKGDNPATVWLTSKNLSTWNFGGLSQRLDPNVWNKILGVLDSLSLGFNGSFILILGVLFFLFYREKLNVRSLNFSIILTVSSLLGPLLFINLYYVHDYYFIPLSTFMSLIIPILIQETLKLGKSLYNSWPLPIFLSLIIFMMWQSPLGISYYNNLRTKPEIPERSLALKKHTTQSDLIILVNCNNWDPTILYYADRRGMQIWEGRENPNNISPYNAIMKCGEISWTDMGWITLEDWSEVQSDILVRKNLNVS